ncbi:MAG: DEAD/DEAH box helicase [Candidatus Nezhaarchaeota archaeon]|nr:DEAD/DEAH box helicase [Candidatus Nezhaarchaeota archaeon]
MQKPSNAFSLLLKPVQEAIVKRGFKQPTETQERAIPLILQGRNLLIIAPTATGKTEAALLPIFSLYLQQGPHPAGIKVLYVTPLRSLNRDLLERLEWWGKELGLRVAVRHGDTESSERSKQAKLPPDMLITTPETLQALMSGYVMRRHLRQVRWVVVDEVHELAEDKRGSQLSLALERLRWVALHDFQIIGLSATVGSPEVVACFLAGAGRPVDVVKVPVARLMRLTVIYPEVRADDYELAAKTYTYPEVAARLRLINELISSRRSALIFVNTRSMAEVLASRFKVWDVDAPVSIHHGSLSKPSRVAAEQGLKTGLLKGLVCTSSLELGIDIGHVDLVVQYMSPRQVTRLVQRVGRSGHRVGLVAEGVVITADPDDTLEAMVICRKALSEELEPVKIPSKPLDVLNHQIAACLMNKRKWRYEELIELFSKAYPYRDLTTQDLSKVLSYMHNRYPRLAWIDDTDRVVLAPRNHRPLYEYFFSELSMIPDEKSYLVVDASTGTPVGTLDEAFVAEYGEPGVKFVFRGSLWRLRSITSDYVYVEPTSDPTGAIPSWVGEEIPVPFSVAQEVGRVRRYVGEELKRGRALRGLAEELSQQYCSDPDSVARAIAEIEEQVKHGFPVPCDELVLVEDWGEGTVVVHAHLGTLANRALGRLLGDALAEKLLLPIAVQQDPYRVVLYAHRGELTSKDVVEALERLKNLDLEALMKASAWRLGLFKRRLIHVARRFGAISKSRDAASISIRRLMEAFKDTPIEEEALKEFMSSDVDLEGVRTLLKQLGEGRVRLIQLRAEAPTPMTKRALERASRKTELIPPERMHRIIIESAKARLLNETRYLTCTNCWGWFEAARVMDLPDHPSCPRCRSRALAPLDLDEGQVKKLLEKAGRTVSRADRRVLGRALKMASLVQQYGKPAIFVLAGRDIDPEVAEEILGKSSTIGDELVELVVNAEKEALRKRFL